MKRKEVTRCMKRSPKPFRIRSPLQDNILSLTAIVTLIVLTLASVGGVLWLTEMRRRYTASPLASAFLNDCIASGMDAGAGGARYNFNYPNFPGIINVIDSLSSIRQLVYEEKTTSGVRCARTAWMRSL